MKKLLLTCLVAASLSACTMYHDMTHNSARPNNDGNGVDNNRNGVYDKFENTRFPSRRMD